MTDDFIALDFETTSLSPRDGEIRLITTKRPGKPAEVWDTREHSLHDTRAYLTHIIEKPVIAHNLKFEAAWLHQYTGKHIHPKSWCTYRAEHVLTNGTGAKKDLWSTTKRHIPHAVIDEDNDKQKSDWSAPVLSNEQIAYALSDVVYLHTLQKEQEAQLVERYPYDLDVACIPIEVEMEANGIGLDMQKWITLAQTASLDYFVEAWALEEDSGLECNFSSPKQVKAWLSALGVDVPSTSSVVLAEEESTWVKRLLAVRKFRKLATSYGKDWILRFAPHGRVHTSLAPRTETGRYSSSSPNVQQIPRGPAHRLCFVASPNCVLVGADYSAIELRVAAFLAREEGMLSAFASGLDVHRHTSTLLFNIPYDSVTKEQRQTSKALSFGLLYGMGAAKLRIYAMQGYGVHMSLDEAQDLRTRFFRTYPALKRWQRNESSIGQMLGYAQTYYGRRRVLPRDGYTEYLNTAVQGTAADLMKQAMVRLRSHPSYIKPILTVHDELLLECEERYVDEAKALLQSCMVAGELSWLLAIECKSGPNWAECH